MAKNNNPVARARGRKPAPVKKPFPVGFAVGCLALALALGGIITYAAMNQGLGDKSSLTYAEHQISGLHHQHGMSSSHLPGAINYGGQATAPPFGGNHNDIPQTCQAYTAPIANEHAVHSLEHGAVWITYDPSLSPADVNKLKADLQGDPSRMLSPYPGLKSKVSLQAWGEQLFVKSVTDKRIARFLDLFTNGPQTREPGKACSGTTTTGPLSATPAPTPTPTPTATTKPGAKPTAKPKPTPTPK